MRVSDGMTSLLQIHFAPHSLSLTVTVDAAAPAGMNGWTTSFDKIAMQM